MSLAYNMKTPLGKVPYGRWKTLADALEKDNLWRDILNKTSDGHYNISPTLIDRWARGERPSEALLQHLNNAGETVELFMKHLQFLAKKIGNDLDIPQFILQRQYRPVIFSTSQQVKVIVIKEFMLTMLCKASGFPTPQYQWYEDDKPIEGATSKMLTITRCSCTARNVFRCKIYNEVPEEYPFSSHYRQESKQYSSELMSNIVELSTYVNATNCKSCTAEVYNKIRKQIADESSKPKTVGKENYDIMMTTLTTMIAADKVALIIANRSYAPNMANLVTPLSDAQTLADSLQKAGFKTVTVGDLNLEEMKEIIKIYANLLSDHVYAVFYFVGHGFEINNKCFLTPIGTPETEYGPDDCLSIDYIHQMFKDHKPDLNLILLDICRKFMPQDESFKNYNSGYNADFRINRNCVYGYATSGGVGAYEVKGERNGVFMSALKKYLDREVPIVNVLTKTFRAIEKDPKVRDVQVPELVSNLTLPRGLFDPLDSTGHTTTQYHHNSIWQTMHHLPDPIKVDFPDCKLTVLIWFSLVGKFTNMVYVFSSVDDYKPEDLTNVNIQEEEAPKSQFSERHLAYVRFDDPVLTSDPILCEDECEGSSIRIMITNLQTVKTELKGIIFLVDEQNPESPKSKKINFGHLLVTRLHAPVPDEVPAQNVEELAGELEKESHQEQAKGESQNIAEKEVPKPHEEKAQEPLPQEHVVELESAEHGQEEVAEPLKEDVHEPQNK